MKTALVTGLILAGVLLALFAGRPNMQRRIGPTESVVEVLSGIEFLARVDTGANTCSIHCDKIQIQTLEAREDSSGNTLDRIRFQVRNKNGAKSWLTSDDFETVTIKTSDNAERRYKVWLPLRCGGLEKRVQVTLNDRSEMTYPFLIGRNFLQDDFLVDVSR